MSDAQNKRLIEANFPLKDVSEDSVREKNIRQGHISTLHIWWARRPLSASRATALAALLPDYPSTREEFLRLVKDISPWEVVSTDTPQSRALLDRARKLILDANGGKPARVLDCFAGGGAIPLEALRLGCETYALDYNPVAVLIEKAVLEFPQIFGQLRTVNDTQSGDLRMEGQRIINPLVEEIRRWGTWVLEEARNELDDFYPHDEDGSIPVGYIWARTLPCQNPECSTVIPLLRQLWLANKGKNKVALRVVPDKKHMSVGFEVVTEKNIDFDPGVGTISKAHVRCPVCANTIDDEETRKLFKEAKSGERMVAVVLSNPNAFGKVFRLPTQKDLDIYALTQSALSKKARDLSLEWGMEAVPNEEIPKERPSPNARGLSAITRYEINRWCDLYNLRQSLALITFVEKIRQAHRRILDRNPDRDFAGAVVTYLALTLDKLAMFTSNICMWKSDTVQARPAIASRQAVQMVWDYFEMNPVSGVSASWQNLLEVCIDSLAITSHIDKPAEVRRGTATALPWPADYFDAVLTDPPYYDNVPYSDLSDFFYVWLKRSIGDVYPELFVTPLTPKADEAIWHQRNGGNEAGKKFFEVRITQAFCEIQRVLKPDALAVIVFAHKATEAWEVVITAMLRAGLYMTASWPIHTEMEGRLNAQETASLASSIYMVCRKRVTSQIGEFPQVKVAIDNKIRERLGEFWQAGIRGADIFMSAIGPAVEVFGHYERVDKLSGETVEVKELLDYVEKVVSEFALERILGEAELSGVDPETRFYLLWRWTYNSARVPFDEARKLATAVGTELTSLWGEGQFVRKEKEFTRALGPKDREKDKKFMNQIGFNTMVDALHRACIYWERGERRELKELLAQTYGANSTFWRVVQNIANVLPDGDKEKQLLQGLLNIPEARHRVAPGTGKLFSEGRG